MLNHVISNEGCEVVMKTHDEFEKALRRKQIGYVMEHPIMGIEIKCTEKYKGEWERRGFKVKEKTMISLLED